MAYTLEQLAADCHDALKADPGAGGREKVRQYVSKALKDKDLCAQYLSDNVKGERTVLYEDPELGFCICGHVYKGAKQGAPHDHGPTWAIYGQAEGETEMTDWDVVSPAKGDAPAKVKLSRKYKLVPGDAHVYPEGAVHAPYRDGPTRLIRIEGVDTMKVKRTPIEIAE
ncbi:MAG: hypothetical protein H6844_00395 [Alphaproteobacteria bacterium]|nr:hypothetical protein [Alphaproteobacteria bacterium]